MRLCTCPVKPLGKLFAALPPRLDSNPRRCSVCNGSPADDGARIRAFWATRPTSAKAAPLDDVGNDSGDAEKNEVK